MKLHPRLDCLLLSACVVLGTASPATAQPNPYLPAVNPYADLLPGQPGLYNPAEMLQGKRLSDWLQQIQARHAQGHFGPEVRLDADVLRHLNLAWGDGAHFGLLRQAGRLPWPASLAPFEAECRRVNDLLLRAVRQAQDDAPSPALVRDLVATLANLQKRLDEQVAEMTPSEYIAAKRFLNSLMEVPRALQHPDLRRHWREAEQLPRQVRTVADLVQFLSDKGLQIGPAQPGDEAAYQALTLALQTYRDGIRPPGPER
jgi:hypothetical protein